MTEGSLFFISTIIRLFTPLASPTWNQAPLVPQTTVYEPCNVNGIYRLGSGSSDYPTLFTSAAFNIPPQCMDSDALSDPMRLRRNRGRKEVDILYHFLITFLPTPVDVVPFLW